MKPYSITKAISLAAGLAVWPLGLAATPAPSTAAATDLQVAPVEPPPLQRVGWEEVKKRKLRHAYWILEQADHNYAGHRAKALEEVRRAGKIIGMDLKGDGYGGKPPHWSDSLLVEAKRNLLEIVDDTGGREHKHIREAIKEINRALEVH